MRRVPLCFALMAGLASAAAGQESVTYSWTFAELQAGTGEPSTSPNGRIDPGEEARLQLTVTISPGIGSTVTYVPPPAPGVGTIAGLASIFFDLNQTDARGGSWTLFGRAPGWSLGSAGTGNADGSVSSAQAGQFYLPSSTVNPSNPIVNIWRGVWIPSSYALRTVTFTPVPALASGGHHSAIIIQYGMDPSGNLLFVGKYVDAVFGSVQIPIVPAPSALALVVGGCALLMRPRRGGEP